MCTKTKPCAQKRSRSAVHQNRPKRSRSSHKLTHTRATMARSCHKHTTIMIALALLCNLPLAAALVANNHAAGPLSSAWATATPKRTTFMTRPSSSSLSLSPWDMPAIVPGTLNRSSRVTYRSFRKSTALSDAAADNVAPSAPSPPTQTKTMVATAALLLLDAQFRSLFTKYAIPFPSSLAGCGALFSTMIFLSILDEKWGDDVYQLLNPGANLLAKWLPVFFVPSLITLPLASGLGNALDVS